MAQYHDVHSENPQPRTLSQIVRILEEGGLIAYPIDSCYAFDCAFGSGSGIGRIRRIQQLGDKHHSTLVIFEFSQLRAFVEMGNWVFRAAKATTPGPYTFIPKAIREVPKMMQHPKRRTIGIRVPDHCTTLAPLDVVNSSLVSPTLLLPDHPEPPAEGQTIEELLDHKLDAVLDFGDYGLTSTTAVNLNGDEPEVVWVEAGGPDPFE